ncbi:flowering time control protein FCA [Ziziphus jujuba]|uniref:Flowering time control protein FCA n=1 Tax=Ziziphus jujuba TaxID=326968 RepID=A0ABM3I5C3_ZIZJJ|nr:flowering time control protein FCA [Ziziphus jujuba]
MRDELKQSRGCGFVKYSHREMALAAINALNGCYTMRGCDQPLTVRFADPKRPRPGDSRGTPASGNTGFSPRFQAPGARPVPNFGEPMRDRIPPNAWRPMSRLSPNAPIHGFGGQLLPMSGGMAMPMNSGGQAGGHNGPSDYPGVAVSSQQSFNQSMPQVAPVGRQISQLQKPLQSPQQLPPSLQSHPQNLASYSQTQTSLASVQQLGQPQLPHSAGQTPLSQPLPSQQLLGLSGQLSVSQPQVQQSASSATALHTPLSINLQPHAAPAASNQKQLPAAPVQQQLLQPPQKSPSQLAQMLSQQTQSLQASFQSSQQAFSQLQQQLQQMQPPNQGLALQQSSQATKQQQWAGITPQALGSTPAVVSADVPSSTSAAASVPATAQAVPPVKGNWTEHTSPDGYKYYYNSVSGESKWEKPEELILYEQQHQQQQQKVPVPQPQSQSLPQHLSTQQVSQTQQLQLQPQFQTQLQPQFQTQLHNHQQLQQRSLSSSYQASGIITHQNVQELGYTQLRGASNTVSDPSRFQQGLQAAQEWMWKNKPAGA